MRRALGCPVSRFAWVTVAAVGLSAGGLVAQDEKFATVFAFSAKAVDGPLTEDQLLKAGGTDRLRPRANGVTVYHLYVKNATEEDASFVVEVNGGAVATATVADIPAGKWKRVTFAPTPAAPPAAVVPPAPGVPAPEPNPAGKELPARGGAFPLAFRLLDKDRKPLNAAISSELKAAIVVADPATYVSEGTRQATVRSDSARVTLRFGPPLNPDMVPQPVLAPAQLKLSFPRFGNAPDLTVRDAFTRRTLSADGSTPTLSALVGGYGRSVLAHVAVDGVERAFAYRVTPTATGDKQFEKLDKPAARVFPTTAEVTAAVTKPVAAFPVRVEVDNAKAGDRLELHVRRRGATEDETEVIRLGGPRQERVWVQPGESQGLAFGTRSRDWVYPLSLVDVRGKIEVVPVLKPNGVGAADTSPLSLVVDDTPPDVTALRFTNLVKDRQLLKGNPLRVTATVRDLDCPVAKAVFLLGTPGEDGKPTPTAVTVVGTRVPTDPADDFADPLSGEWTAALPLPTDKRGELTLWVRATDDAGNTGLSEPKRIEIVDAPPPKPPAPKPGAIRGVVCYAERPQPGMTVKLVADGKHKGETTTDDKGRFTFDKLPAGAYQVTTTRTDYSTGLAGLADVAVEPGATTKPLVTLKRLPPPK